MALGIPVVWTKAHGLHHPETGVWIGLPSPADETPERAETIRIALVEAGAPVVPAESHPDDYLLAVRDTELLSFLPDASEASVGARFREAGHRLGLPASRPCSCRRAATYSRRLART